MISLVSIILIIFSVVWFLAWTWFFKSDKVSSAKFHEPGEKAFVDGNYKLAKEMFLQAPDLNSALDIKYMLGVSHLKLGEYDEARACFEQILKSSPNNFDALFSLAQTLELQGKYDEALEIYAKAAKLNDKNIDCPLNIGRLYCEKGDYDKALEALEKAKEIAPNNTQVSFFMTKCKSESCDLNNDDNRRQMIDEYAKLVGSEDLPDSFDIYLATLYAKDGQTDKALTHCKRAVEINEEDAEAYKLLGLIQLIQKNFTEAKNNLTIALNFQPSSFETHNIFSYLLCINEDVCAMEKCRSKYFELVKKHLK